MRTDLVGVSGNGASERLRLGAVHPSFEIAQVGGESTAQARMFRAAQFQQ